MVCFTDISNHEQPTPCSFFTIFLSILCPHPGLGRYNNCVPTFIFIGRIIQYSARSINNPSYSAELLVRKPIQYGLHLLTDVHCDVCYCIVIKLL